MPRSVCSRALVVLVATLQPLRRLIQPAARTLASTDLGFAQGVSELTTIGREIQVFGVEDEVDGHVDRLIDDSARAARRHSFVGSLFTPLYATVMLLLLVLALAVIWNTGLTNLEELGAVVLLMLRSFAYGQMAQAVWSTLYASAPFLSDLQEQLDSYAADRVDPAGVPAPEGGELDVRGVSYSYRPRVPALDGVSFRIEPGEIVGVIGPSGSGKSTLVQLLLRLRQPAAGSITLDGRPIGDIALADWRRTTSFVPQEPRLIAGTVESNIRFFRDDISHEMIEQAARRAHIHDEIVALPDGYQTVLGGPNAHLSGGQQQRLCITRALVTRPAILVLDEPTSALDAVSEARIRDSLDELRGDVTTVIVAHRLSTLDICDRILVLQEGRLVAFDTPPGASARRHVLPPGAGAVGGALTWASPATRWTSSGRSRGSSTSGARSPSAGKSLRLPRAALERRLHADVWGDGFGDGFLRHLGADLVDSLDASDFEGATIVHDLNLPAPTTARRPVHGGDRRRHGGACLQRSRGVAHGDVARGAGRAPRADGPVQQQPGPRLLPVHARARVPVALGVERVRRRALSPQGGSRALVRRRRSRCRSAGGASSGRAGPPTSSSSPSESRSCRSSPNGRSSGTTCRSGPGRAVPPLHASRRGC